MSQCVGEQPMIVPAGDLDAAEAGEMRRQELGVEQEVAAETQPGDEVNEGDLARLALAAEHAFAKKDAPDRDTVQATRQHAVAPALHTMRCTAGEECRVEAHDLVV